jgi:putative cell wall-binding protein
MLAGRQQGKQLIRVLLHRLGALVPFRVRLAVVVVLALAAMACAPSGGASATTGSVAFPSPSTAPSVGAGNRVHHVAVDGSDEAAGTATAPWGTLYRSLERLEPGDTLVVHGGTYRERVRSPRTTPATAAAPIHVLAAPGERPVVQGLLWLRDADHWVIDGINVTWDPDTGSTNEHMVKFTDGTGWVFRNAEVWDARSFAGILVATSGGAEPRDWLITGNCIHDTVPSNDKNQDHLIYVNSGTGSGPGMIQGNLLFGAPNGNGVKLGGPSETSGGAADITIRHNTIHGAVQGVLMSWRSQNNVVARNLIGHVGSNYGTVRGYQLAGTGNVVTDNVGYDARLMILNDEGYEPIADGGGNVFPLDPEYGHADRCGGFVPTHPEALGYGHLAQAAATHVTEPTEPIVTPVAEPTEPVVSPVTEPPDPVGVRTVRVAGNDRVATAVAAARHGWVDSGTAVLARADDPADALAGAALAGALDAPLLITPGDHLAAPVADVLGHLGVETVVVLGGRAAVADTVTSALGQLGVTVDRVAGTTREHTAALIARRLGPAPKALLVRGRFAGDPDRVWPDALAVSGLAARAARAGQPIPILLVGSDVDAVTLDTMRALGVDEVVLVGGTSVLPEATADALRGQGFVVDRWAGSDRYATSRLVNDTVGVEATLVVATGRAFPDGLAAGALAARLGGSLLISSGHTDAVAASWIGGHAARIESLVTVGGTSAVPDETVRAYAVAAG